MTVLNAAQLVLLGILTLVMGVPAILLAALLPGKSRKGKLFLLVSRTYARIAFWFFRIRAVGSGMERIDAARPYVFLSNHISLADSAALAIVITHPLHWVFKKELAKIPVFGWVLLACGQIMVDRSSPEQSRASLERALSGLSGNNSVMIYPEGFWMALQAGLPIVPVRVSGSREVVPADTLRVCPGTITVEIFPPIETRGKTSSDIPELIARVREAMLSGTTGPA
jgi:1-acyl-sn-glycerol-3-phosphate acyltransferase